LLLLGKLAPTQEVQKLVGDKPEKVPVSVLLEALFQAVGNLGGAVEGDSYRGELQKSEAVVGVKPFV